MSYTTILGLKPGNKEADAITYIKDLPNSHGSAPVIWDQICQEYLGTEPFNYMIPNVIDKLWTLSKDKSIPKYQRAVLTMTYDKVYIKKENYKRAVSDIHFWLKEFPANEKYINHWEEIANIIETSKHEAIGFQMTSITDNLFEGEFNEETEEYLPNWEDSFEVYDELK